MRSSSLLAVLLLSACTLPGRQSFSPEPVAAAPHDIAALNAFAGRIALVSIKPGTADYAAPLKQAVDQALAIKPSAEFQVVAQCKQSTPDDAASCLSALAPRGRRSPRRSSPMACQKCWSPLLPAMPGRRAFCSFM